MIFGKQEEPVSAESLKTLRNSLEEAVRLRKEDQQKHGQEISTLKSEHAIEIKKLESDQIIALQEKEFEIKHVADERVLDLQGKLTETEKKLAVSESENKMLHEMVDQDASVLEVKELVSSLINKLPNINIGGELGVMPRTREDGPNGK